MKSWMKTAIAGVLGLGLGLPAFGADQARPGTVNYVEGAVYLDGQPLTNKNVGNVAMDAGQVLSTRQGRAEVLLTPGIYLRLDENSAVEMIRPSLIPTQVELKSGRAGVEVDQLLEQNDVQVIDNRVTTKLNKTGYYEFDANHPSIAVSKGEAEVQFDHLRKVKGGHQLALSEGAEEASFKADPQEDQLMNWSKLRSQYLAEANNQLAENYGPGYNPGWYWSPWTMGYTYMAGSPFYSPFGWGYYPFGFYGGFAGMGWGGYYGRPLVYGGGFHGGFHGGRR